MSVLKRKLDNLDMTIPWWEQIAGTFAAEVVTSIISYEEQRRGWMMYITRIHSPQVQIWLMPVLMAGL